MALAGAVVSFTLLMLATNAPAAWQNGATLASATPTEQGNKSSIRPSISADGRYVAFFSGSTNFAPAQASTGGIFRRDLVTGQIDLVAKANVNPCGVNVRLSINSDGRYVVFDAQTALVPADTNNFRDVYVRDMTKAVDAVDAFELVSARDGGSAPAGYQVIDSTGTPVASPSQGERCGTGSMVFELGRAISNDGRHVIFTNNARTDLPSAASTTTQRAQIFIRDLDADTTSLVTKRIDDPLTVPDEAGLPVPEDDAEAVGYTKAVLSGDGSTVSWSGYGARFQTAFHVAESATSSGGTGDWMYLWRRVADGNAAKTRRVTGVVDLDDPACDANDSNFSLDPPDPDDPTPQDPNHPCNGPLQDPENQFCNSFFPSISDDGRKVAFLSCGDKRDQPGSVAYQDAFVADMTTGVSRKAGNRELTRANSDPDIGRPIESLALSGDASKLALVTKRISFGNVSSPTAVGGFPTATAFGNLFVIERLNTVSTSDDTLELVSRSHSGTAGLNESVTEFIGISQAGNKIVFSTIASNALLGDANSLFDAFVANRIADIVTPPPPPPPPLPPPAGGKGPVAITPFALLTVLAAKNGQATLAGSSPGGGLLTVAGTAKLKKGRKRVSTNVVKTSLTIAAAGQIDLKLSLNRIGKTALKKNGKLAVALKIEFKPNNGGAVNSFSRSVTFKGKKKK